MRAQIDANYLLYIMMEAFPDVTNMKLNKLLYFAQGHFLQKYQRPLFDDRIEAWTHGPVIPSVYAAYRQYEDKPISVADASAISEISPEEEEILYLVALKYGRYTASALRNMTHRSGSPWAQVYQKDHPHNMIPNSLILTYFSKMEDLSLPTRQYSENDFVGYRDRDGVLVLPKEWDDEEI